MDILLNQFVRKIQVHIDENTILRVLDPNTCHLTDHTIIPTPRTVGYVALQGKVMGDPSIYTLEHKGPSGSLSSPRKKLWVLLGFSFSPNTWALTLCLSQVNWNFAPPLSHRLPPCWILVSTIIIIFFLNIKSKNLEFRI